MSDETKTKEEHIVEYITKLAQYEMAMEPYKDGIRDMRQEYKDNSYLTGDEMRQAVRAYRFIQKDVDLDDLQQIRDLLKKTVGHV